MTTGEFASLIAFWFLPPCLIAFWVQWRFYARHPMTSRFAQILTLAGTPPASIALSLLVLGASPSYLHFLDVIDIKIGGGTFSILPLAYVSVAVVGTITLWASGLSKQQS